MNKAALFTIITSLAFSRAALAWVAPGSVAAPTPPGWAAPAPSPDDVAENGAAAAPAQDPQPAPPAAAAAAPAPAEAASSPPPPAAYAPPQPAGPPPPVVATPAPEYGPGPYGPPPGYGSAPGYPPPYRYAPPPLPGYPPTVVAPAAPGAEMHDGFYLHLHVGPAFTHVAGTDSFGTKTEYSGGGASFGISVGGSISSNVVLFGTILGSFSQNPQVKIDGASDGHLQGSSNVFGVGGGMAYYFTPYNVYLAGSLLGMTFELQDRNNKAYYDTDTGLGVEVMLGKEWWISDNWGLGLAGEIIGASMKDKNDDQLKWSSSAFGILLSATYN